MTASVKAVQQRLVAMGFSVGPAGADGKFGSATVAGVSAALDELSTLRGETVAVSPVASGVVARQPKAARPITEIIIHCTATPESRDVSVETIRGWHLAKNWRDIGYHYVVALDGTIRAGRPEAQIGSHVQGHNTGTLGIVYVGGVAADGKTAKDTRTPAQRTALMELVKALIVKYPTVKKVTGHNQYAAKACPSFDVRKDPLGSIV
jgi:N-acetylmuramoyl-L-alanine amidase